MVAERKIIRGKTPGQQLASVEHVLQSFRRKLSKTVIGFLPPIPIFVRCKAVESDGIVDRLILPVSGTLTEAFLGVQLLHKSATIALSLHTKETVSTTLVTMAENSHHVMLNWPVHGGMVLEIRVQEPTAVNEVIVGLLLMPELSQGKKEQYLIENLDMLKSQEQPDTVEEEVSTGSAQPKAGRRRK